MKVQRTAIGATSITVGLIAVIMIAAVGYIALSGQLTENISSSTKTITTQTPTNSTQVSTQTRTSNATSQSTNETCATDFSYCREPLNYTMFQNLVQHSSSIDHQNGTIILTIGYNPCIVSYYVLPNATDVNIYMGTQNTSQTCE